VRIWTLALAAIAAAAASAPAGAAPADTASASKPKVAARDIAAAERIIGLEFTDAERDSMLGDLVENLESYIALRGIRLENAVAPSIAFDPLPAGFTLPTGRSRFTPSPARRLDRPRDLEDLAFLPVRDLAELVRTRKVTSTELTKMYLDRLKRFGPKLECVVTLTEARALEAARRADEEIARGRYRGLLHGIPYGAKDLLAVKGYPTTWGAMPYADQVFDEDASVIRKLDEAGAVLVAKLTLGALAWGDVWFGGTTRNPWNLEQGSSGSSAGSAAATAAGLVAFGVGTETWGSIVSPSTRCGATGLRPTYGRVSRAGAMALSWSMDKIGPICRTVEDCAIVFEAIRGPDGLDRTVLDVHFDYASKADFKKLRVGYLKSAFDGEYEGRGNDLASLETLRSLGADLVPIELPDYPVHSISFILSAEAAAAFDELTRSGRDDLMVRQVRNAWPNVFRSSRFIPAVEYIQANRLRRLIVDEMARLDVDVWVSPSFGGTNLLLTNLTGHPCVVLPNGFDENGSPTSITFMGRLFGEGALLAVAKAYQDATDFHLKHPPLFE
jgi:Asp-tRNA(Asn)/Glu-tRNA(Gln) amidotransferase A subunit family amidase